MYFVQGINRVLLENLLPAHVASHYLSIIKGNGTEELYSHRVRIHTGCPGNVRS